MSIHYKFKSSIESDTIIFDGLHISVGDLKKEIVQRKKLGKLTDFDLQITNAQTKEQYVADDSLIPKNTTLIIARIPAPHANKRNNSRKDEQPEIHNIAANVENAHVDLATMEGTEEDKIEAMMTQSSAEYNPLLFQKIRGNQTGEVPLGYRCYKCKKAGHWIKNCPLNGTGQNSEIKKTTGIPKSFLEKDETSNDAPITSLTSSSEPRPEIPEDLKCKICNDLLVDAVMIPCCGTSFCDECVRAFLLQSEENECPDCKEKGCSPSCVIPNRFLRKSVQQFKNEGKATSTKSGNFKTTPEAAIEPEDLRPEDDKKCSADLLSAEPEVKEDSEIKQSDDLITPTEPKEEPKSEKPEEVVAVEDNAVKEKLNSTKISSPPVELPKPPGVDKIADNVQLSPTIPSTAPPGCELKPVGAPKSPTFDNPKPPGLENSPTYKTEYSPPRRSQQRHPNSNRRYHQPNSNFNANCDWEHYDNIHAGPPPQPPHLQNYKMGYPNHDMQAPPPGYMVRGPPPPLMAGHHGPPRTAFPPIYGGYPPHVDPPGVIDDPLAAFEQIMKEKEQLKQSRRRSPERHRSRSPDRNTGNRFGGSPSFDRHSNREPNMDRRSRETERRRNPFSDHRKQATSSRQYSPNGKKNKHTNSRSSPSRNAHTRSSPPRTAHSRLSPPRNAHSRLSPSRNAHSRSSPPRNVHSRSSPSRNPHQRLSPARNTYQRSPPHHQRPTRSLHQRMTPPRNMHQRLSPPPRNMHMRGGSPSNISHQRLSPLRNDHKWNSPNRNAYQRLSPNRNPHHASPPQRNVQKRRSHSRKSRSLSRGARQHHSPIRKRQRADSPREKPIRKPNFEMSDDVPSERNDRHTKRRSRSMHQSQERMFSPPKQFFEQNKHEHSFTPPTKPDISKLHRSPIIGDDEFAHFQNLRRLSEDRNEERRRQDIGEKNYGDVFRRSVESHHSESTECFNQNVAEESGPQDEDSSGEKPTKERKKKKKDKEKNKKSKKEKKHKRSKSKKNKRKH